MPKQLKEMSLVEKKAVAYDLLSQIEQLQRNLQVVNQAIAEEMRPKDEPKENGK